MKKHTAALLLVVVITATCCSSREESSKLNPEQETIGTALLEPDGTIILTLASEDPDNSVAIAHAQIRYKRNDPQYADILKHVGPLKVGVAKNVRPWP